MKSEQIQNLIESLSPRMAETKPEAEARVEKAKAYCAEHGKNRMARLIKGDLSGIQMFIYNVNRAEDVDGGAAKRSENANLMREMHLLCGNWGEIQ